MHSTLTLVLAISSTFLQFSGAVSKLKLEQEVLEKIISESQQNSIIRPENPLNASGPVIVNISIHIRRILGVDDINMEYTAQLLLRQKWNDKRLAYESNRTKGLEDVTLLNPGHIWTPDGYFSNEISGHFHNILSPNAVVRIFPNGDVHFNNRVTLKLSCPMNFKYFPLDRQICSVLFTTFGSATKDVVLLWDDGLPKPWSRKGSVANYVTSRYMFRHCRVSKTSAQYSCLELNIFLVRDLTYYVYNIYMPFVVLVMLSWIPFWLDHRKTTSKICIWVGVLLCMTIISCSVQLKLPTFSTHTALGVWIGICWNFVLAVILEFVIISQLGIEEEKKTLMALDDGDNGKKSSKFGKITTWLNALQPHVQRIDVISRICFPLAFILFNIIYWFYYLCCD